MCPRHEATSDLAPIGVQLDRRHCEHEQTKAEIPEDPLDPLERQDPGAKDEARNRNQDQEAVGKARQQLKADGDPANLRGTRHETHDFGCDERHQSSTEPGSLTDQVKYRPLCDCRNAAAHLRVHDDPDHADHDHPQQLETEDRSRLRVEHEIADVDEPANRRQDA